MDKNEFKILAGLLHMVIQADGFHLSVARALLSPKPLSERDKVDLLTSVAQRERTHEQMEAALVEMRRILGGRV